MRLSPYLTIGVSSIASLAAFSSAHPLIPRNELNDSCWDSIRNPVYNEYWVNITNDAAYNEAPWCGASFLNYLRGWCGIISNWQCDYDRGAAIMYFKTDFFCTRWKVTQAIKDGSNGERHISCWEGVVPDPEFVVPLILGAIRYSTAEQSQHLDR